MEEQTILTQEGNKYIYSYDDEDDDDYDISLNNNKSIEEKKIIPMIKQ